MSALVRVPFRGDELLVQPGDTPRTTLVVMRPIVERLGLDWTSQHVKIAGHPVLGPCVVTSTMQVGSQAREVMTLPLDRLPFWLAGIQTGRIPHLETRALVLRYQIEAADALYSHFFGRRAMTGITPLEVGGVAKGVVHKALAEHLVPIGVDLVEQRAAIAAPTAKIDRLADAVSGKVESGTAVPAREFITALDVLVDQDWPQRGCRAMVASLSARLSWFAAERSFRTRKTAERGTRLFHVDAVTAWRAAGGDAFLASCRDRGRSAWRPPRCARRRRAA